MDNWANYPKRPVNVYDGASSTSPLLGTFGGGTLPNTILSTNNTMFVTFESHYKFHLSNNRGFEVLYTALEFDYGKFERMPVNIVLLISTVVCPCIFIMVDTMALIEM